MLVITCRFAQLAAPIFEMDVSCINTRLVLATVPFSDRFYYNGSKQTWNRSVQVVTAREGTTILRMNIRIKIRKVWKELCYGKAETLEDAEEAARWW